MRRLDTKLDTDNEAFNSNRVAMLEALEEHDRLLAQARAGGGERAQERHRSRGKLLPRERVDLLVDVGAHFLELSPLAAWGTEFAVGASVITGVGVVSGTECVVIAHDPTIRGGASNPVSLKKTLRALAIARENRLPVIQLVESGGADLPSQVDIHIPGGQVFHDLTELSSLGIPTVALVFGNATAGGAYVPGMSDYSVMVRQQAKVFLGGPPLVKVATGEDADDEELGGAEMHSRVSGLSDYLAHDDADCVRIGREIIEHLRWKKLGPPPAPTVRDPEHPVEDLLGLASMDTKVPFDPREVVARVADGSLFEEYKAGYGLNLVTGWCNIHGYPVGVLANYRGVLFSEESHKATEFIQLSNQTDTPLVFMQNTTGYIVGTTYERRGIIKDGAKMINAVTNSTVPHITINIGASYGAGNYGMAGRSYRPRFVFSWPNARTAVMGGEQLAGVLSIVARQSAEARGLPFDDEADSARTAVIIDQIERESQALFMTGRLYDDGIIDPRETRTVLAIALSAAHSAEVRGRVGYGVFRM